MITLRERGVYELPDGRRYVAESALLGGYYLFDEGGPEETASYRVSMWGQVLDPVTLVLVFRPGCLTDTGGNRRKGYRQRKPERPSS